MFELVCPSGWAEAYGILSHCSGSEVLSPHRTPWLGPGSSLRASGKCTHFWVGSCGFTETADLFLVRGWWSSLIAAELSVPRVIYQGRKDLSRPRWNLDHHTEKKSHSTPVVPAMSFYDRDVIISYLQMRKQGPEQ